MLIGIDASKAAAKNRTGVENYTYQLILALKKVGARDIFLLYTNSKLPKELANKYNMVEKLWGVKRFWNKIFLPIALLRQRPDAYIQPLYMMPLFAPKNNISVVHDLAWAKFPHAYSKSEIMIQKLAIQNAISRAKHIVCVSDSTRNDLIKLYPKARKKATVIYPSYNEGFCYQIAKPKNVIKSEGPYFLFAGRVEERKNIIKIVEAFKLLKDHSDLPHKLVIAGKPGYNFEIILNTINRDFKDVLPFLIFPGYVQSEDMPHLFAGAEAFLYPTLYEGFGLAALDAMSAGIPVITSNKSSMPEAVGDSAVLVDPADAKEIAQAMFDIATSKKYRDSLIKKGLEQIKMFSWEKTANEFIKLLETK
ncbi:MAG: glycosyltransferase family 1 protein [Patescibacteria group bacterium]